MPEIWWNPTTHHCMSSQVAGDGYVALYWPKDLSLIELDFCKEVVNHQLDAFRKAARRKEVGEIEYDSWREVASAH